MASSTTTSAVAAATSSAVSGTLEAPKNLKVVGVILAVASGVLIGSSFVLKKKGLIRSQAGGELGEGVAYLKSALWWGGMILMVLGELCNFAAYAFVEAIVVTPLGALSVVVSAALSSFFLNEKLSFFGWLGCALCILGSIVIALNAPHGETVGQIREFQKLFLAPGFLSLTSVLIVASLVIVFYFAPKYGKKSMLWYIFVCSMIGGISVSVTTGLGAAIVTTAMGDNQFKHWFMYFLFAFVVITLLVEIYYLNIALALFNTAMVTPTYYVIFTFFTMVTTIVLFQGLKTTVTGIITIVLSFIVICIGITILQLSKVDPKEFNKLDRRSTLLLQAARAQTDTVEEKTGIEDPGMDTLRGSFGTVGSIIRARRMSQSSRQSRLPSSNTWLADNDPHSGLKRHQLYDAPVPRFGDDGASIRASSIRSQNPETPRKPTIKFDDRDLVHSYNRPGQGENKTTHELRPAPATPTVDTGYPPLPAIPSGDLLEIEVQPPSTRNSMTSFGTNVAGLGSGGGFGSSSESTSGMRDSTMAVVGTGDSKDSQLLTMSALLSQEHAVHSAPATMYQRPLPYRKDSRDIFDRTSTTARDTLLSFPSVTDSARSQDWDDGEAEKIRRADEKKQKEKQKQRDKSKEREKRKKYPKVSATDEDDKEESEALWTKSPTSESEPDELPPEMTGIRLVQRK
ncbi:DUF803 domain membrane protein [Coprinopsis cinerea okayama7|uniref:DUF803 domain membrane protein n=1 Tax=Coprinopsis cinerea (strain Okayama-7 / 130 / ATCC MYA-4618 / FGSC 9003) TaxID=240176 RepID=A8N7V2_COPC7|nr:DUF803 domain membrane protein [Coprinopsis cinerea okayama7\|eukprot:XP_001830908.1 DUF803 domain membrane protein [Coprinopsis cinerea okayama7\